MKDNREITSLGTWTIQFREEEPAPIRQKGDVLPRVAELIRGHSSGRIAVDEDVGGRSWIERVLLGLHPRFLQVHFSLEWSGEVAALIFFDEAESEHRAIDREHPIAADETIRRTIANGEFTPIPVEQCMSLRRAHQAIEEYLKTGVRPGWLEYEYVQ